MTKLPSIDHLNSGGEARLRSENSLKQSQVQMMRFIRHAPISMAMFDRNMNYLATSNRWLDDYGQGRPTIVGLNHYVLLPDLPSEWKAVHQRGLAGETITSEEDRWVQADGTNHWLRWSVVPWTDEDGEVGGIIISTENITERIAATDALRQISQRLSQAEEIAGMGSWHVVFGANVSEDQWTFSSGLQKLFGYSGDTHVTAEAGFMAMPPEDQLRVRRSWESAKRGDGPAQWEHQVIVDGKLKTLNVCARFVFDQRGRATEASGTALDITERKATENKLRTNEAMSVAILDSMSALIAVIDPDGVILAVNEPWRIFSLANSGKAGTLVPHTDVGSNYLTALEPLISGNTTEVTEARDGILAVLDGSLPIFSMEYPCAADKQQRWFHMSVTPLCLTGLGAVIAHTEITDHKRANQEAERKQRILDALLDCIPEGVAIVTAPELATTQTSRYSRELLLGGNELADSFTIDDWLASIEHYLPDGRTLARKEDLPLWRAAHNGETIEDCELTLRKPNNEWLSLLCNAAPWHDSQGIVEGAVVVWRNITTRKAREQALQDAQERLAVAQTGARAGLWHWNLVTDEADWSDEFYRLFEFEKSSTPANYESFRRAIHPEDVEMVEETIQHQITNGLPLFLDYRISRVDGEVRWIRAYGNPTSHDDKGTTTRICGIAIDITDRKAIESELKATRGELEEVLSWQVARHTFAAIAHELNQPLTSLSALSGAVLILMRNRVSNEDKLLEVVQQIALEAERASESVRHLMVSVRKPNIVREDVLLSDLLRDLLRTEYSYSGSGNAKLSLSCPDDLPPVHINAHQVVKVMLNLIKNSREALKTAGESRGRIWIGANALPNNSELCVTVRDNGPGISPSINSQLFYPFITDKPDGLGMGLAICRSLIEAQGGRIWHEADNESGAIFHFTLPIAR